MRKLALLIMGVFCLYFQVMAQKAITGKVTDDKGNPLPNASVLVKGTKTGTTTKPDGTFSITVPADAKILVISAIDMIAQELPIDSRSSFEISLKTDDKALQEVVVTGYQTLRKKDVASAISTIKASDIDNLPNPNFANAMQGRAAGVIVANANGLPGGNLSVIIRGVGSITAGTTPLYVVDGIQLNTNTGSINTQNNPLNFLNPDDIESIEILKDAAAASIYGARAANGVVVVTTKKGKNSKPKFVFNFYAGQSSELRRMDPLTTKQWYDLRVEALVNAGATPASASTTAFGNLGLPGTTPVSKLDSLPNYDWQEEAFSKGEIINAELSMQGGNQNVNYYLSGSYSKFGAFIAPADMERAAALSKLGFKINEKFSIESSISLSTVRQNAPYSTGNTGFGNPAYAAAMMLPINPVYNPDGTYYGLPGSGQTIVGTFNHNILAVGNYVKYKTQTNQFVGSIALQYKPIADLTIRTLLGLDYRTTNDHRYQDPRVNDAFAVNGRLSDQFDWNTNWISTTTANYRKIFNDVHSFNALAGLEFRHDQNQWFQADGQGFPTYLLEYGSAASTPVGVSGQWTANATFSQFAKLNYTYDSRYVVGYTIRRDGSSRFGENNKYGIFQSAQVAWNAKEEAFLQDVNFISDLKLRLSYGEAGNDQINDTRYAQLYGASRVYGNASAINPSQLGNPDLSWETRTETNLGLDLSLLRGRLNFTVDAYIKQNKDLLLNRALYNTTGFANIAQNLGRVENRGIELLVSATPFDGAFKWTSSFNIAFQKNEIKELYDGLQSLPSDASIRVGESLGSFFVNEWAGVNPATGRSMWYDLAGNLTYNPLPADRKVMGDIYPNFYGGWTNTLTYKGFSLDFFFQYEYGRVRQDGQYTQMMRMAGTTVNTLKEGFDLRWQKPGDISPVPRTFNGMADYNSVSWATGSRYLFKTDYIRLKQITLGYELPATVTRRFRLDNVRFYVQGVNLWTHTEWPTYDPEFTGDNFGIIPVSKNVTAGVQVRF